jgi:hypothetical protein
MCSLERGLQDAGIHARIMASSADAWASNGCAGLCTPLIAVEIRLQREWHADAKGAMAG